jgi:hypothetical protein
MKLAYTCPHMLHLAIHPFRSISTNKSKNEIVTFEENPALN